MVVEIRSGHSCLCHAPLPWAVSHLLLGAGVFSGRKGSRHWLRRASGRWSLRPGLGYDDPHWYANIGYYCDDENQKAYAGNGKPDESGLYVLNAATGEVSTLLDGKGGSIRDPHVHYDGKTILFSYRRRGKRLLQPL